MPRLFRLFFLILGLAAASASALSGACRDQLAAVRWAERLAREASVLPTDPSYDRPRVLLNRAATAFEAVIRKHGPSPRALVGLAEVEIQLGYCDEAVRRLEDALAASPQSDRIRRKLESAKSTASIAKAASAALPRGHSILRLMRYSVSGRRSLWLALSARTKWEADWRQFSDIRLTLFKISQGSVRRAWQSQKLGYPGYESGTYDDLQLYLVDVNGDSIPEVVIPKNRLGAWYSPSHLDIFVLRNSRMVKLLGLLSEFPIEIRDLNHDGRYEVLNEYGVGWDCARADQVYWRDIYAFRGGSYRLADGSFPGRYRRFAAELRRALRNCPNDYDFLKYSGIVSGILGKPGLELRFYRRAQSECSARIRRASDPAVRRALKRDLADIRRRIARVTGSPHPHRPARSPLIAHCSLLIAH